MKRTRGSLATSAANGGLTTIMKNVTFYIALMVGGVTWFFIVWALVVVANRSNAPEPSTEEDVKRAVVLAIMRTSCTQSPSLNFPHPLRAAINPTVSHNRRRLTTVVPPRSPNQFYQRKLKPTRSRCSSILPRTTRLNAFGGFPDVNRKMGQLPLV